MPQTLKQKQEKALTKLERDLIEAEGKYPHRVEMITTQINNLNRKLYGVKTPKSTYSINNYLNDIQQYEEN